MVAVGTVWWLWGVCFLFLWSLSAFWTVSAKHLIITKMVYTLSVITFFTHSRIPLRPRQLFSSLHRWDIFSIAVISHKQSAQKWMQFTTKITYNNNLSYQNTTVSYANVQICKIAWHCLLMQNITCDKDLFETIFFIIKFSIYLALLQFQKEVKKG